MQTLHLCEECWNHLYELDVHLADTFREICYCFYFYELSCAYREDRHLGKIKFLEKKGAIVTTETPIKHHDSIRALPAKRKTPGFCFMVHDA
jgi:hypothetical protein